MWLCRRGRAVSDQSWCQLHAASPVSLRPLALPHALPACISLAAEMGPWEHWAVGCGVIAGVSCNPEPLLQCWTMGEIWACPPGEWGQLYIGPLWLMLLPGSSWSCWRAVPDTPAASFAGQSKAGLPSTREATGWASMTSQASWLRLKTRGNHPLPQPTECSGIKEAGEVCPVLGLRLRVVLIPHLCPHLHLQKNTKTTRKKVWRKLLFSLLSVLLSLCTILRFFPGALQTCPFLCCFLMMLQTYWWSSSPLLFPSLHAIPRRDSFISVPLGPRLFYPIPAALWIMWKAASLSSLIVRRSRAASISAGISYRFVTGLPLMLLLCFPNHGQCHIVFGVSQCGTKTKWSHATAGARSSGSWKRLRGIRGRDSILGQYPVEVSLSDTLRCMSADDFQISLFCTDNVWWNTWKHSTFVPKQSVNNIYSTEVSHLPNSGVQPCYLKVTDVLWLLRC